MIGLFNEKHKGFGLEHFVFLMPSIKREISTLEGSGGISSWEEKRRENEGKNCVFLLTGMSLCDDDKTKRSGNVKNGNSSEILVSCETSSSSSVSTGKGFLEVSLHNRFLHISSRYEILASFSQERKEDAEDN
jgi:hypothetical protein